MNWCYIASWLILISSLCLRARVLESDAALAPHEENSVEDDGNQSDLIDIESRTLTLLQYLSPSNIIAFKMKIAMRLAQMMGLALEETIKPFRPMLVEDGEEMHTYQMLNPLQFQLPGFNNTRTSLSEKINEMLRFVGIQNEVNQQMYPQVGDGDIDVEDAMKTYFAVPGLTIGYDNQTGKFTMVQKDSYYPHVMLPSNYLDHPAYNQSALDEELSSASKLIHDQLSVHNKTLLFYPLQPTKIVENNLEETAFLSIANGTELKSIVNGSMHSVNVDDALEFDAYNPDSSLQVMENNEADITTGSNSTVNNSTGSETDNHTKTKFDLNFLSTKHDESMTSNSSMYDSLLLLLDMPSMASSILKRTRRALGVFVPGYFDLIYALDDHNCFERLTCEIGANKAAFGRFGETFYRFMEEFNFTAVNELSSAKVYALNFELGKEYGNYICAHDPTCKQNFTEIFNSTSFLHF